ncbi:MAG: putative transcriptional regulator, partial [Acidobacteriota bacterium]|nr:putative transcriptional regulator [Acidobacteriota bacterium]
WLPWQKRRPAKHAKDAKVSVPHTFTLFPDNKKSEDNKMNDNEMIDELLIPLLPGIGERIKKFREYRGLTFQKMAQLMDTTEFAISQIETGEIPIPMPMLLNLCQYLGANLNWLLTGKESMVIEKTKSYNPDKLPDQEPNLEIKEK